MSTTPPTDSDLATTRQQLIELIEQRALKRGSFTLASGRTASFYLDAKQVVLDAQGSMLVGRAILQRLGVAEETVSHVCRIVGSHHSAKDIDTPEFRIVWDADWLANIPDEQAGASPEKLAELVARVFKTKKGRTLAENEFLD